MKHAINWFEIPAANFERAVTFYNTILDASLRKEIIAGVPNGILPYEQDDSHNAIGGAVIFDERIKPGMSGILPYLNCTGKLDAVLSRMAIQRLAVGIRGDEIHAAETKGDHGGDGVRPAAAHAYNLYLRAL